MSTPGHTGIWTTEEDIELKGAVQMHDGKNSPAIAALVPGRTKKQCSGRWVYLLDLGINRAMGGHTHKWTPEEDDTLSDAVQIHGHKNWVVVAALLLDRRPNEVLVLQHVQLYLGCPHCPED